MALRPCGPATVVVDKAGPSAVATCRCGEQFRASGPNCELIALAAADRHLAESLGVDLPPLSESQLDVVAGALRGHDRRIAAQRPDSPGGSEAPGGAPPR